MKIQRHRKREHYGPTLRGWATVKGQLAAATAAWGDTSLDAITTADVERFLDALLATRAAATRNRYRTVLHAAFGRAVKHGLIPTNPATGTAKSKETGGRLVYLLPEEEAALRDQLAPGAMLTGRPALDRRRPDLRPLFAVSVHTGLRWSEQRRLVWGDVDVLARTITVRQSKSGHARTVPINRLVRSVLVDLAAQRARTDDPEEPVFRCPYGQPDKFFPRAVERAQAALKAAGKDISRLEGYTWHGNRHTFASRLVMAGVDLRTVQVLGGWRTLAMVERYSHLSPAHLREAVERMVPEGVGEEALGPERGTQLSRNYPEERLTAAGVS